MNEKLNSNQPNSTFRRYNIIMNFECLETIYLIKNFTHSAPLLIFNSILNRTLDKIYNIYVTKRKKKISIQWRELIFNALKNYSLSLDILLFIAKILLLTYELKFSIDSQTLSSEFFFVFFFSFFFPVKLLRAGKNRFSYLSNPSLPGILRGRDKRKEDDQSRVC